jgi:hypothetical protein
MDDIGINKKTPYLGDAKTNRAAGRPPSSRKEVCHDRIREVKRFFSRPVADCSKPDA